jgi:DNA excision repair protein ERCC-4
MNPVIQIDTREQQPLRISAYATETVALPAGDYGIKGFSDWTNPAFIVERKSLPDLIGSLTTGRERFMKVIERMRAYRFAALVIEAEQVEVEIHQYQSATKPQSVLQSLAAIQTRANVHVIWCGNPDGAARCVERLVRQFVRGVEKDYKRLARAEREAVGAA